MPRPFEPVAALPIAEQDGRTYVRLVELMQRLLADDGCPWDREQSIETLRKYVLEEACEVIDAIDSKDREHLCEELGDLALQVVFLSELARRENAFGPDDIIKGICDKLVRRHPHVFADAQAETSEEVLRNWELIKAEEKKSKKEGILSGVPRSLPSLVRATRMGEKVARVGFDWPDAQGSRDKVREELAELDQALASGDQDAAQAEFGDVLFALVNFARHTKIDAEAALRATSDKFARRFAHVEKRVREDLGGFPAPGQPALPLQQLDLFWDEAKAQEKAKADGV